MIEFGVIAFSSTHCAIRTERHLRGKFPIQMMPTLRNIAVTCGISVRFQPSDLEGVRAAVAELGMDAGDFELYCVHHDGRIELNP